MLTPQRYDFLEREAEAKLPNRLVAACRPSFFEHINYPTRTSDPQTLWRWADVMHECRFEQDFAKLLDNRITAEEYEFWRIIAKTVFELTTELGQPILPRGALARAVYTLRCIQERVKPPQIIVEIGPGSGYLSAFLALFGYTVVSVENCQTFYLWQHRFFERLRPNHLRELASRAADESLSDELAEGRLFHMPWWRFYRLDGYLEQQPVALLTANHCLCEMSRDASTYIAQLSGVWNQREGFCVVVDGVGVHHGEDARYVEGIFRQHGVLSRANVCPIDVPNRVVGLEMIEEFENKLCGRSRLRTPDEQWLYKIYGEDYYS